MSSLNGLWWPLKGECVYLNAWEIGPSTCRSSALTKEGDLGLMLLIDKQFLEPGQPPFYGVRQMIWRLQNEGHAVNQKRRHISLNAERRYPLSKGTSCNSDCARHNRCSFV